MKPVESSSPSSSLMLREPGRVAIVSAQWHAEVIAALLQGAKESLAKHTEGWTCDEFTVPGSFEIPQAVSALAKSKKYDAIVPLGCLIRGETAHFDLIAGTVFRALDHIGRKTRVAISNGVLTVETREQALARAGGSVGNKGEEAMVAALSLHRLLKDIHHD